MAVSVILAFSIFFQLLAAFFAIRLIRYTGFRYSWVLISFALVLMCVRRAFPLYHAIFTPGYPCDIPNEAVGLLLSIFMFTGVYGIRSIFAERLADEEAIRSLLAEKELMMREVHHRIKNNMNVVAGILFLQQETLKEPQVVAALKEARGRVVSMMLLYDKLYRSESCDRMSFRDYFDPLVDEIADNFPNRASVRIEKRIDDFSIDPKKMSHVGIIVNELITNAMKYAFAGRKTGVITVFASSSGGRATVTVADDGVGMPENNEISADAGFGRRLMEMLVKQLRGSFRIERGNGMKAVLEFDL